MSRSLFADIAPSRLFFSLTLAGLLSLTACAAPEPGTTPAPVDDAGTETPAEVDETDTNAGSGAREFAIGVPTSFEVFPNLEEGHVARITINSFDYTLGADFEQYNPRDPITAEGLLIINLTWETLEGSTQFNSQYVKVTHADGTEGVRLWENLEDATRNGNVRIDEPRTGNMAFAIDRGVTTITITDHEFTDTLTLVLTT